MRGSGPSSGCRRGNAFGLSISSNEELAGIQGPPDYPSVGRVAIEVAGDESAASFSLPDAEETFRSEFADGSPAMRIHRGGDSFRIWFAGSGSCVVKASGERITCVPPFGEWPWGLLYAQALPLAAALHRLEVLHASAVEVGGRALIFAGASGSGKTTLALRLLATGARLLADDVVALEAGERGLLAHPGVGIANVADDVLPLLGGLGCEVGLSDKHHIALERPEQPLPVAALVFLARGGPGGEIELEPVPAPSPRDLLAATFVFHVTAPDRLVAQLDVCARLASSVPVWRLRCPDAVEGDAVTAALITWMELISP
jgi:hypothetical protein